MIKLGYVAPKKGGKTQFLITMIQEEFLQGHRCYYLGGQKHYEEVTEKLEKQGYLIPKSVVPTKEVVAFFDIDIPYLESRVSSKELIKNM